MLFASLVYSHKSTGSIVYDRRRLVVPTNQFHSGVAVALPRSAAEMAHTLEAHVEEDDGTSPCA